MTVRPHRPYGVKIVYRKSGDPSDRAVYYFSCDVENRAFPADSPLHRFFAGLERTTTFVKSGSYLLHWNNFSTLRRLILEKSLYVLQDDTAVPYRFFEGGGWEVRLFGRYVTPVKDFTNVEQPDLRRAYEDPSSAVSPLPFHFGYRWRSQIDNLLLARRLRRDLQGARPSLNRVPAIPDESYLPGLGSVLILPRAGKESISLRTAWHDSCI